MLTVYGRKTSSNVQLVMWAIGELGLEHERLDYGHVYGGLDTPEFGAMNPHRRVPVLRDGDLVIWESCAILRYLAARYGDGGDFWPADPARRAPVDMWAEYGKTTMGNAFSLPIFWPMVRMTAAERDEAALARAITQYETLLDPVENQLRDRTWLLGDTFTAADIVVGHLFYRWFDLDIPRRPRPAVEAYYARLTERPAFREHVMVDYAPLRAPGG